MTIRIDGTNTAANPGITGTDTDTGLQFGTDEVNIVTGGSTRATVDSSGRLGVGTTSPAGNTGTRLVLHDSSSPRLRLTNSTTGETASDGGEISLDGSNLHIENRESAAIRFYAGGSERAQLDSSGNLRFNSGYGSVTTAFGCRAWVRFDGTGTVFINGDGGVTSISDNATGIYTINFDFTMPDTNYSVVGTTLTRSGNFGGMFSIKANTSGVPDSYTTSGVRILTSESTNGTPVDPQIVCAAIFR